MVIADGDRMVSIFALNYRGIIATNIPRGYQGGTLGCCAALI
jgi:hypothetical protein